MAPRNGGGDSGPAGNFLLSVWRRGTACPARRRQWRCSRPLRAWHEGCDGHSTKRASPPPSALTDPQLEEIDEEDSNGTFAAHPDCPRRRCPDLHRCKPRLRTVLSSTQTCTSTQTGPFTSDAALAIITLPMTAADGSISSCRHLGQLLVLAHGVDPLVPYFSGASVDASTLSLCHQQRGRLTSCATVEDALGDEEDTFDCGVDSGGSYCLCDIWWYRMPRIPGERPVRGRHLVLHRKLLRLLHLMG